MTTHHSFLKFVGTFPPNGGGLRDDIAWPGTADKFRDFKKV
jgi:hypothetical protein